MDRFLIVANWKANAPDIKYQISDIGEKIEVVVAAPFTEISKIPEGMRAAQDVSTKDIGAFTGEVPAKMLADLGVKYCLVGHSEQRKYFSETNSQVEVKIEQLIKNGIVPIVCAQSLEEIPENIRNFSGEKFLIMYEPFSAISTEGQYHPEKVENIVTTLLDWKKKLNLSCRFLYGGSINPDYVSNLLSGNTELISGLVVGHASLDETVFFAIIEKCLQNLP